MFEFYELSWQIPDNLIWAEMRKWNRQVGWGIRCTFGFFGFYWEFRFTKLHTFFVLSIWTDKNREPIEFSQNTFH